MAEAMKWTPEWEEYKNKRPRQPYEQRLDDIIEMLRTAPPAARQPLIEEREQLLQRQNADIKSYWEGFGKAPSIPTPANPDVAKAMTGASRDIQRRSRRGRASTYLFSPLSSPGNLFVQTLLGS